MHVHTFSIHSLRMAYGKNKRDDAMIDRYLQNSHESGKRKRPPEYR